MTNPSPAHLRLHVEELPDEQPTLTPPELAPLLSAFEEATGWTLRHETFPPMPGELWSTTIDGGDGQAAGRLVLSPSAANDGELAGGRREDLQPARRLALAIGGLVSETNRLKRAVWQREAELAAGVPVASRPDSEPHLADRLESVLKGGAEAVACQAAGLYLLDEGTSELKLRAAFNLPEERLLAPPRPLRGAVADLEALVGHAVVLEDTALLAHWKCPEEFPSAVCVPVSSPTIPLGTLWIFSETPRDFSAHETNLIEIVAGRLAADLEREMLLATSAAAKGGDQQIETAARWLEDRLPSVTPLVDGYEVAGWTEQAGGVGGDFHDWSVLTDGRLALMVGDAEGRLLEAALGAAALHTAVKAHGNYRHDAAALLRSVNESLLANSAGDQRGALAYCLIDPEQGALDLALAGPVFGILVGMDDRRIISVDSPCLGLTPDARFHSEKLLLARDEAVVLLSSGVRSAVDPAGLRIGEAAIASLVHRHARESAKRLASRIKQLLMQSGQPADDMTVLVLKRGR